MKKNPIIRWISGATLLLGGALVILASTSAAGAPEVPAATPRIDDAGATAPTFGRCDEGSVRSCRTSCIRTCRRGPFFGGCSTTCDRTCRSRFCR
jgi:hypothetical protein